MESDGGILGCAAGAFGAEVPCDAWSTGVVAWTPQAGSCRSDHEVLNQTRNGSWSVRSIEAGAYGASDPSRVGRRVAPPQPLGVWHLPARWPGASAWSCLVFLRSTPRCCQGQSTAVRLRSVGSPPPSWFRAFSLEPAYQLQYFFLTLNQL